MADDAQIRHIRAAVDHLDATQQAVLNLATARRDDRVTQVIDLLDTAEAQLRRLRWARHQELRIPDPDVV